MFKNLCNNELVKDTCNVSNRIISLNFSTPTIVNINEVENFLNEERIKEVLLYKKNECISPVIFKLVFLHMSKFMKMDTDVLIKRLTPLIVEEIKLFKSKCSTRNNYNEEIIINEYKASCENCLTRRDCFTSSYEICDEYRPSPTKLPNYWPKYMQGPY